MRDLDVGRRHNGAMAVALLVALGSPSRVVQIAQDILGINQGNDAVQINGASQTIIHPEEGC